MHTKKTARHSGSKKLGEKSCEHAQVEIPSNKHQGGDGQSHKSHATRNTSDQKRQRKKQKYSNVGASGILLLAMQRFSKCVMHQSGSQRDCHPARS